MGIARCHFVVKSCFYRAQNRPQGWTVFVLARTHGEPQSLVNKDKTA
nr:MAG TPA: hypothetical protein [Caudoviricetes sp.]